MRALEPFHAELVADPFVPEEEAAAASPWTGGAIELGVGSQPFDVPAGDWAPPMLAGDEPATPPTWWIEWAEVDAGAAEAIDGELVTSDVALVVHNDGEQEVEAAVRVLGDGGTTLDYLVHEEKLVVAGKSSALVHPGLAPLIATSDFEYSGHLAASAVFSALPDPDDEEAQQGEAGVELARESSGSLFFHPIGEGKLSLYNHAALEEDYALGDLLGQYELADEAPLEPTYVYRILGAAKDEDDGQADDAMLAEPGPAQLAAQLGEGEGEAPAPASGELAVPPAEDPQTYTVCVRWEIMTSDSNWVVDWSGEVEDKWPNADGGILVAASGVRLRIGGVYYDTNANGCVTFGSTSATHSVTVYEYVKNGYDTIARLHTGGVAQEPYPGSTYSWILGNVTFIANGTKYLDVGDYTPRTTTIAVLGYALTRFAYGVSHAIYHVTPDYTGPVSVHYGSYWPGGGAYDAAYLAIKTTQLREKFTIAHEYGHGFGNFFGPEEMFSTNYTYDASESDCGNGGGTNSHSPGSMEWSMDAAHEGWGNFVSAMVWNDKEDSGSYRGFDLESWEVGGYYGGRMENYCLPCPDCPWDGAGTGNEIDWTLAFWDFYTDDPTECSNPPSSTDVARFWGTLTTQGPGGGFPDHPEGWDVSSDAADLIATQGHIGTCFATRWYWKGLWGDDSISHYNGLRQPWN